jgi:hypothetical protein
MDTIRKRFDQILAGQLERLLGKDSGVTGLPFNLWNISLTVFLAEQAANERDQMISEDDRYTRKALYAELAEVGLGSKPQFYQVLDNMFNKGYIIEDDSGRLLAGKQLLEIAQLLDTVLPKMPGLNLIAYVTQTLDEAISGRKDLEDALSQFDQTLSQQGILLSDTQGLSDAKDNPTVEKKDANKTLSTEMSQRLIKAISNSFESKPTRQSKVLSSKNQTQIKTVAFGKAPEIQGAESQDNQKESSRSDNDDSDMPLAETKLEETDISPEMAAESEPVSRFPEREPSDTSITEEEQTAVLNQSGENPKISQEETDHDETGPDQNETVDDVVEKKISQFETDLAMQCPICKSAQIVSELTSKGKEYYKCPNKSCNFISWGKPFHNECPRCHNPFLIEAQKNGTAILKCPRATCNYWQGGTDNQGPSNQRSANQMRTTKSGVPKRRRRVVKRRAVRRKKK